MTRYYGLYQWLIGAEPPAKDTIDLLMPNYTFLAAGLQATGPDLSPGRFRTVVFERLGTTRAITEPYLTYGDRGYRPDTDDTGRRRRHADLVGPGHGRPGRDPRGGHRQVGVRRRR